MLYRVLKDGTHAIGMLDNNKKFIVYASAFDAREARALIRAWRSILDLFHVTSGAWVTMVGATKIPRGATFKGKEKKTRQKRTRKP